MLSKRLHHAAGHFYRLRVNPAELPCLLEHSLARREGVIADALRKH